jgi:uncharacterized Zn finger protein
MAYFDDYYAPSRPRRPKGGIKAQTQRGGFGKNWWAQRWVSVLESFDIGGRLERGRSYARSGQVLDLDIAEGKVKARVQGSRPEPYRISIDMRVLSPKQWGEVAAVLRSQAKFAAKLLSGEMPENIEDAFKAANLSLFLQTSRDLRTECTCPDWSNPCKHIAAVYYLLGEEFDRDPFLILRLRGMGREAFLGMLRGATGKERRVGRKAPVERAPPMPISPDPETFWGASLPQEADCGDAVIPRLPAALVTRLGNFPLWRGEARLAEELRRLYEQASPAGLRVYMGEPPGR